ncbi:MAG: hypothetical protein WDN69_16280 [Aliidongia sp.]
MPQRFRLGILGGKISAGFDRHRDCGIGIGNITPPALAAAQRAVGDRRIHIGERDVQLLRDDDGRLG